jgi:hypothetical protein
MAEGRPVSLIPLPGHDTRVKTGIWDAGRPLHRIHSLRFAASQFNPGLGDARFSPLRDAQGLPVPTLYAGASPDVAIMETLFHDLPQHSDGAPFDLARLGGLAWSRLIPLRPLTLIVLTPMTLRRLGIKRSQLLDSDASQYPITRLWALALWQQNPTAQGLCWSSRQHGDEALMLFGDRVAQRQFDVEVASRPLIQCDELLGRVETLADEMGVVLLPPGGGYL